MKDVVYVTNRPGHIVEENIYEIARFVTAKNYDILYAEALPRFQQQPLDIYALPFGEHPKKIYNGIDREGADLCNPLRKELSEQETEIAVKFLDSFSFADTLMNTEATAQMFLELFQDSDKYELIWVRNSGVSQPPPTGYDFIGYDVAYPPEYCGAYSMIGECMFICRCHGCDVAGTLFASDFNKLNENGLFDTWQDAYDYMIKYLTDAWTEPDRYCILEIYRKPD